MNSRNLIVGTISIVVLGAFVFMGNKNKENEVRGVQSQTISTCLLYTSPSPRDRS